MVENAVGLNYPRIRTLERAKCGKGRNEASNYALRLAMRVQVMLGKGLIIPADYAVGVSLRRTFGRIYDIEGRSRRIRGWAAPGIPLSLPAGLGGSMRSWRPYFTLNFAAR